MKADGPLSRIRVVLSRPSHPGNIGAAARAMKTMGITRLVLVRPRKFPDPEARAMATGAADVLESARVCADLDAALEGTRFSIAMSARGRDLSHPPLAARAAAQELVRAAQRDEVALVFGNETVGLSNREVMRCGRIARIPSDAVYKSLNLAQAVQVMAYEVRMAALDPGVAVPRIEYASHEEIENFYEHLERSLYASGFLHPRYPRRLMDRLRRLFARARLEKVEVNILRGMLAAWEQEKSPKK
ncbi:MAG TPA: RNA methyltransferase [Burkholderiales bacterium]